VQAFNGVLEQTARTYGAACLPFGTRLTAEIRRRLCDRPGKPYALRIVRLFGVALRRYVARLSYDEIADRNGFVAHTDSIHLNERAAALAAELIANWLADTREPRMSELRQR
jgi:acyl-CoA thioesterase-1